MTGDRPADGTVPDANRLRDGRPGHLLGSLADDIRQAAGEAVTTLFTWWASTSSTPVDTDVVHTAQRFATVWIAAPIAVLAVLAIIIWTVGTGSPA